MKKSLFVCLALVAVITAKLEVFNFPQLDSQFTDNTLIDIPYSIANFGFSPFGKTMIANLKESPGLNLECSTDATQDFSSQLQNSFMLIPRGECTFVQKALHAQEMGAAMAIIMDNEQHKQSIIMKDDGYGYKVNIPVIFINYEMGMKLVKLVNATEDKVVLKVSFENLKTDIVDVNFYLQATNPLSYRFVEEFAPFYKKMSKYMNLNLVYEFISCKACAEEDCFFKGAYCSVNYEHAQSATGKDVMNQQVRESVMFQLYKDKWWGYMNCIKDECIKITELESCSDKCVQKRMKMDLVKFKKEVQQSFTYDGDNNIIKSQTSILKNSGVEVFPSVTINSIRMKGSLKAEFVVDDICNSLNSPPSSCSSYTLIDQRTKNRTKMYWVAVFMVVLLGSAVFVGLFIFCRRKMKKRMTVEMQGRVDDMVSKYIEFYSERNNRP